MNIKKGDKVKIIKYDVNYMSEIPIEDIGTKVFDVIKKFSEKRRHYYRRRLLNSKYSKGIVKIRLSEFNYTNIPIEYVIKVNTKMYILRDKLLNE